MSSDILVEPSSASSSLKRALPEPEELAPASPTKKARLDEEELLLMSYRRLVNDLPVFVRKGLVTGSGPIDWASWEQEIAAHAPRTYLLQAIKERTPSLRQRPSGAERTGWLWFFAALSARYHYGSYEVQCLLFAMINHYSRDSRSGDMADALARELSAVAGTTLQPLSSDLDRLLGNAVHAVRHAVQLIRFRDVVGEVVVVGLTYAHDLRYHSFKDEYARDFPSVPLFTEIKQ